MTVKQTTTIARQQLCKYATVLGLLLGSGQRVTMEVPLGDIFYVIRSEAISLDRLSIHKGLVTD
jgi:hypothetical protein